MFIHTAYDKPYMLILGLRILCAIFFYGYLFFANARMGQVRSSPNTPAQIQKPSLGPKSFLHHFREANHTKREERILKEHQA
jgi:hypothetical protein